MTTLTDIYDKMISNGSLEDDLCQREIVEQLENISRQVSNLKRKSIFFRKSSDINGAYIWGGVGCGKSMLMDLFVENLSIPNRKMFGSLDLLQASNAILVVMERIPMAP